MRTVAMGLWRIRGSRPAPRRFPAAVPYRRPDGWCIAMGRSSLPRSTSR